MLGTAAALVFVAGVLSSAYALACARGPAGAGSIRLACTSVLALALAGAMFLALAFSDQLTMPALTGAGVLLLAFARWGHAARAEDLAEDRQRIVQWWRELGHERVRWPVALLALVLSLRFARALASPPLATDSLTYHLFRAGRWVQQGALVHEPAPDAWGYYDYYPILGDGYWALTMAFTHTDVWLAVTEIGVLVLVALGGYALARALGTDRVAATLASAAILTLPSVLVFGTSAYVDTMVLALFSLGVALVFAGGERGPGFGVLAFALAAGIKVTGVPVLALGGLFALGLTVRLGTRRAWLTLVLASGAGLVLAGPPYLRAALEHQNPLYPFGLSLGGVEIWTGNVENTLLQTGALAPPELTHFDALVFLRTLFLPRLDWSTQHLNLGPVVPMVAGLAVWGVGRGVVDKGHRALVVLLALVVAVFLWRLGSPSMLAHRTFAAPAVGRFLIVPVAALIVLAASTPRAVFRPVALLAIVVGVGLGFPRGMSGTEVIYALVVTGLLVGMALAARGVLGLMRTRGRAKRALMAVALAVLLAAPLLEYVRDHARTRIYAQAVDAIAFDPHPTDARAAAAWPIWQWLDQQPSSRIAFAAGWDGRGHHWYRYPVLGRRLQHDVVYISPTHDGAVIDYREHARLLRAVDLDAWLGRLRAREVQYLLVTAPKSIESIWAAGLPDLFALELEAGPHRLYRFVAPGRP